jgi:hypothetical protein
MAFNPLQTQYGTHIEDNIRTGPVFEAANQVPWVGAGENPNPITYETIGLPGSYNSPIFVWSVRPAAATPDALVTAQVLNAGLVPFRSPLDPDAGVTYSYLPSGVGVYTFDTPRNVTFTGALGATAQVATVQGYDEYGFAMTENIATPANATTTQGVKAFSSIVSISISAPTAGDVSIGTGDVLGFPYFVNSTDSLINIKWAGSDWVNGRAGGAQAYYYISNAPTVIGAQVTPGLQNAGSIGPTKFLTPSTATTADVRGTINIADPVGSDGTRMLTVTMYVTGSDQIYLAQNYTNPANGNVAISEPQQTKEFIGVPQFSLV